MKLFGRKQRDPIKVALNVRAFLEGRLVRLSTTCEGRAGERFQDLLKRLGSEGMLEPGVVKYIIHGNPGLTVLHNGQRLTISEAQDVALADGDELSILTPMAGG